MSSTPQPQDFEGAPQEAASVSRSPERSEGEQRAASNPTHHSSLIDAPEGAQVSADPGSDYLITVQIATQYENLLDADTLHRLAIGVLQAEGVQGPLELGVVVTDDAEVRDLNRQYLGHDYDTDVLSFSMEDEEKAPAPDPRPSTPVSRFVTPSERPPYLGDIAISYDRAAEQAPEYGQSPEAEVATLLIHGILHLLGYDDTQDMERERMHARQRELLTALYVPES